MWGLLPGFFSFFVIGLRRGYRPAALIKISRNGAKSAFVVMKIMLLIGLLTALWRSSGTIAYFVFIGVHLITPKSFLLIAFLLPGVLSLAIGSSLGVAGTAGVIIMAIARSGDADLAMTAGAIISGALLGERLSPAASAVALVAAVSEVDQSELQRRMWRRSLPALILSVACYAALSLHFPIEVVDTSVIQALKDGFTLSWAVLLPAGILLLLPLMKVNAVRTIEASSVLAALVAIFLQHQSVEEVIRSCLLGYVPAHEELSSILSGGGMWSMATVIGIIFISCANCGLFTGMELLAPVSSWIGGIADRAGLFLTHIFLAIGCSALFCNQAVGIVMSESLTVSYYRRRGLSSLQMAENISDTVIYISALIPWCVMCSSLLTTIGGSLAALPFSVLLYLLPLSRWLLDDKPDRRATAAGGN